MTLREKEDERRKGKKGERGQGIESRRGNGKDIAKICISFYKFRTVCTTRAYYSLFAVLVVEFVREDSRTSLVYVNFQRTMFDDIR